MDDAALRTADAQSWALNRLGTKPGPGEAPTQTALRSIAESNYHVTHESMLALRTFAGQLPLSEFACQAGRQERLEQAINEFAVRFFDYTSEDRCQKIQQLDVDCRGNYSLTCWLDSLYRGVSIGALPQSENPLLNELVDSSCKAFVAKYSIRVRKSQELAERCRISPEWKAAIEELSVSHINFVRIVAPWGLELVSAPQSEGTTVDAAGNASSPAPIANADERVMVVKRKVDNVKTFGFLFVSCLIIIWLRNYSSSFDPSTRAKSRDDANRPVAASSSAGDSKQERVTLANSSAIDPSDFFGSLEMNFPDNFDKLCREMPGLRECQSDPAKRKLLNKFAIHFQPDIKTFLQSKFDVQAIWYGGVLKRAKDQSGPPIWWFNLKRYASDLATEQIKSGAATK